MEEKYRHFLFGIVASVGLCFIILVFFTGDEVCINSKLLNISEWVLFGLICATVILGLLFLFFVIKANHETRDIKNTRWHIVTECSQDQELRSKRKLRFHPEVTVFPNSVISYCEAVEQVEFAGSDCYFMAGSFEGCANLEYIKLPHRLERIPDNMFRHCSSLKEIIIPSTVTSIGKNAFDGCSGLTSVVFEDSNGWYATESEVDAVNKTGGTAVTTLSSTDLAANAEELVKKCADRYWYKKKK